MTKRSQISAWFRHSGYFHHNLYNNLEKKYWDNWLYKHEDLANNYALVSRFVHEQGVF